MNPQINTNNVNHLRYRTRFFISEFVGTALLLAVGLSVVIFMFGEGSPMPELIPNMKVRQTITGFLFGGTGALIAISVIGKTSGAHINPAVTMVFWLFHKIEGRLAITYVLAQLTGAIAGCLPLLLWGSVGKSISFAATLPGEGYSWLTVLLGEVIITLIMVSLLVIFIGFRKIRAFTPAIFPVLFAVLVPLESAVSGTSANPARSLGPAIISGEWLGWWIYWIGPLFGAFLAALLCSFMAKKITIAKLYHFDSESAGDALLRSAHISPHVG